MLSRSIRGNKTSPGSVYPVTSMAFLECVMPYRVLGPTGVQVSALGLGRSHIGNPKLSSAEAMRIIQAALDGGLSFMDNSWDDHEGESESIPAEHSKAAIDPRLPTLPSTVSMNCLRPLLSLTRLHSIRNG